MRQALVEDVAVADSLLSRLDAGERLDQAQLLNLILRIADDLEAAHRRGEIHGTITPADILFDDAGEASLAGFGRDTTPDPVGEKPYAPVELYAPVHRQGPWTDVYSLGAVLWRAVTGAPPPEVLLRKADQTLEALDPAGFDPAFLRAVDAALEIAPQRRPQTLGAWLATLPTPAAPASPPPIEPIEPTGPDFPLRFEERLFVAGRPEARRGPLFTIAALDGVAAYFAPPAEPAPDRPATEPSAPPAGPSDEPRREAGETSPPRTRAARWPLAIAAAVFAVWAATVLVAPDPEPVAVPTASVEPVVAEAPPATASPAPAAPPPAAVAPPVEAPVEIPVATTPPVAVPTPAPPPAAARSAPVRRRAAVATAPPAAPPPAAATEPEPAPPPVVEEPAPSLEGASPRALLARADRTLRELFADYERLRSNVRRSYDDEDLRQSVKERAYSDTLRIHDDLLALRKQRNRLGRTSSARLANQRYDDFDRAAARIDARIAEVRRSI